MINAKEGIEIGCTLVRRRGYKCRRAHGVVGSKDMVDLLCAVGESTRPNYNQKATFTCKKNDALGRGNGHTHGPLPKLKLAPVQLCNAGCTCPWERAHARAPAQAQAGPCAAVQRWMHLPMGTGTRTGPCPSWPQSTCAHLDALVHAF